jgi:hypothetical protein
MQARTGSVYRFAEYVYEGHGRQTVPAAMAQGIEIPRAAPRLSAMVA